METDTRTRLSTYVSTGNSVLVRVLDLLQTSTRTINIDDSSLADDEVLYHY